jgi:hypothetical protein
VSKFKIGDRVAHSKSDLAEGWFKATPHGHGTITVVRTSKEPFDYLVEWDKVSSVEAFSCLHYESELEAV